MMYDQHGESAADRGLTSIKRVATPKWSREGEESKTG